MVCVDAAAPTRPPRVLCVLGLLPVSQYTLGTINGTPSLRQPGRCWLGKPLAEEQDTMKFGVLQFFSWPERRVPLPTVYERAMQRIEIMDQTGYDAVWLAEHHFTSYSVCPSVHMMGLHVASRTRHLRIGTGISLAAFYHPLRLAEEVAWSYSLRHTRAGAR